MNNKGVTLIELLIVIVIIGIISAFAVPAVSRYLTNAQKSAVLQDAVNVRNAADAYCSENQCTTVVWDDIASYITNFNAADYTGTTTDTDTTVIATKTGTAWAVTLEAAGDASGNYEYVSSTDPINGTADTDVTVD